MKNLTKTILAMAVMALTFTSCDSINDVIKTGRTIEDVSERVPSDGETTEGSESSTAFRSSAILWGDAPAIPPYHSRTHVGFHKARYDRLPAIYEVDAEAITKDVMGENRCDIFRRPNDVSILELMHYYKNQFESKGYEILLYSEDNKYGIKRKVNDAYNNPNRNRSWQGVESQYVGSLTIDYTFWWASNYILAKGKQDGRDHIIAVGVSTQKNLYFVDQLYRGADQPEVNLY